jgi:hypothetical protein
MKTAHFTFDLETGTDPDHKRNGEFYRQGIAELR